jgi:type VI secretion system protein ImpL
MKTSLLRKVFHPIVLAVLGLVALAALIWWVGPLIAIGDWRPFDGVLARLGAIAVPVLIVVLVSVLGALKRKRANATMVKELSGAPAAASDREAEVLSQRFSEAMKVLDDSARESGKKSFFKRSQYLYELPWYMFIGAPGSGKTTALMNAGLTFPLAGKMGQASVKGIGGTRNCDWWFTDEAVLIDTAGRYTLQQSDEKADASAWEKFLALLKQSRPRRPINGVLLTVNIQDLLQQAPADRKEHAARLRMRLQELHTHLGVRPPVYVLVTKCDLIAGFNETFGELGKEERDQVWGFSFPYDPSGSDTPVQAFGDEFAALETRLRNRLLDQIEAERDPLKRAAIFSFPQQFAGLKGLLGGFLEMVFDAGGNLEERTLLRGVYFTSGTQEGTPIDRVLGTLARTFGVDNKAASVAGARGGKSFFLSRLLKNVVFAEQGLVGENRKAESSRLRLRMAGMAAIVLASVALLVGWGISYMRNSSYIADVQTRLPEVKAAVEALPPADVLDVSALPQVLDKVIAAPKSATFDVDKPPLLSTLGLFQGDYVDAGAKIGYERLLDRALLPRVTKRLEERLRAVNRDNLELAYEALKAYLMLYTPEHFDAESLKTWITLDWDMNLAGTLSPEQRATLAAHLDAALADGAPQAIAPMDATLVANVRDMLIAYPLEFRIFSRMRRAQVAANFPEFSVASAAGPNAPQVFQRASGQPLTKGIPGLFTRDAYFKEFKGAVEKVSKQMAEEQKWVLGTAKPGATPQAVISNAEMTERVRRLYLQEYIKVWDAYLNDVKLVRLDGIERSMAVSRVLAAPDSPLAAFMRAVARETQLAAMATAAEAQAAGSVVGTVSEKAAAAKANMAALVGKQPDPTVPSAQRGPLEAMVDDHFAPLHRLVAGQPAPIDEVLKLFNEVYVQLSAVDAAQKSKSAPPPPGAGGGAAAKAAAGMQPEPIKSMLETIADAGANQSRTAERQGLSAELKPLTDLCARTIAGRFPFAQGSKADVLPDDFGQLFGVGGMFDDFFQRRLAPLVDVAVTPWAYRPLADGSKPPGGASLADFQRAQRIRDAFFRAGGKAPGFKVDLRVLEMNDGLKELTIDIDGQPLKFVAGNTVAQTVTWPSSRVASQIKLSAPGGALPMVFEGPWALFRMLGQFENQPSPQPERFTVVLVLDGKRATMEVTSSSAINPLRMREITTFRCPDAL